MRKGCRLSAWLLAALLLLACGPDAGQDPWLGRAEPLAPGIDLFRVSDRTLVEPAGPIAVYLLRIDPVRAELRPALAHDTVLGAERVDAIAARHGAVAAVNAGFFNINTGEPTGLLKIAGVLLSDTALTRGAVVIRNAPRGRTELAFDQIAARMSMTLENADGKWDVPIDGVNTTRERGRLMLYTPAYHANTDTAANGTDWILGGRPLRVLAVRRDERQASIPGDGATLSYGGVDPPAPLSRLALDTAVTFTTDWRALHGTAAEDLDRADHIIGGAGLLRRGGEPLTDWQAERLNPDTFSHVRHPRTLIGIDRRGVIWLAAVDGRQPDYSIGMAFPDLERLTARLGLTDALNLDGGGSTTMVAGGKVVNRPSDANGPRAVSDALLVFGR